MKDLVIVGAGPAGITAAIYAARKKLDFTVITRDIGGQTAWAGEVGNYPSQQVMTGIELAEKFRQHLAQFNFELREGEAADKVEKRDSWFVVRDSSGGMLETKTVIIASGKKPKLLGVPGEGKYARKGVTYCATCDGPLFAGKDVAVIGGGNSALDAALQMMKIAKKVYLVNVTDALTGDPVMQDKVKNAANVELLNQAKTTGFLGDNFLKSMTVEVAGQLRELPVTGVFIEIGLTPNSDLIDFVDKNQAGEIIINNAAETSCPGVFAAGDVSSVPDKQIIVAAGEGAKALLSASRYLMVH